MTPYILRHLIRDLPTPINKSLHTSDVSDFKLNNNVFTRRDAIVCGSMRIKGFSNKFRMLTSQLILNVSDVSSRKLLSQREIFSIAPWLPGEHPILTCVSLFLVIRRYLTRTNRSEYVGYCQGKTSNYFLEISRCWRCMSERNVPDSIIWILLNDNTNSVSSRYFKKEEL